MKYKFLMAFALLTLLVLSGCQEKSFDKEWCEDYCNSQSMELQYYPVNDEIGKEICCCKNSTHQKSINWEGYETLGEYGLPPKLKDPELEYYEYCHVKLYLITYVDEIWSKNCYAIKQETDVYEEQYKQYLLNNSLKYAGSYWEFRDKLNEENKKNGYICQNPIHEGEAYCLKDNSTCLMIEENRICDLIKLR